MIKKHGPTGLNRSSFRWMTIPPIIQILVGLIFLLPMGALAYDEYKEQFPAPRNPDWALPLSLPESQNFHQISPELFRAGQPSAIAFKAYKKFGIKTVLCLSEPEKDPPLLAGTGLILERFPMKVGGIDDEVIIRALRYINESPKPVLVHCYRGADRTGAVSAAYRIVFEGWSKEAALDEMINGGFKFDVSLTNIPAYIHNMNVEKIRTAVMSPDHS